MVSATLKAGSATFNRGAAQAMRTKPWAWMLRKLIETPLKPDAATAAHRLSRRRRLRGKTAGTNARACRPGIRACSEAQTQCNARAQGVIAEIVDTPERGRGRPTRPRRNKIRIGDGLSPVKADDCLTDVIDTDKVVAWLRLNHMTANETGSLR